MYKVKNRFYKHAKISEKDFLHILNCFSQDLTASKTARRVGVSTRSVNNIYIKIRHRIAEECMLLERSGEPRIYESCNEGEVNNTDELLFGVLLHGDLIFTVAVTAAVKELLVERVRPDSSRERNALMGISPYSAIIDAREGACYKLNSPGLSAVEDCMEPVGFFWSYAKQRLRRFNGLSSHTYYFHLKETEFRFNSREEDLFNKLIRMFHENPLI